MVLTFFNNKGPIHNNCVPRGTIVNANDIVEALGKSMKVFNKERPEMAIVVRTDSGDFRPGWKGVLRTISAAEFATALHRWYQRNEKCAQIGRTHVENS